MSDEPFYELSDALFRLREALIKHTPGKFQVTVNFEDERGLFELKKALSQSEEWARIGIVQQHAGGKEMYRFELQGVEFTCLEGIPYRIGGRGDVHFHTVNLPKHTHHEE